MKRNRRKLAALFALLLLAGLVAFPLVLTWRMVRQEQVNHALIAAIDRNNLAEVRNLLRQGADPNAPIFPDGTRSVWQRVQDMLWHHTSPRSHARESALLMAVGWEPVSRWAKGIDNADTVQALVDAGANVNFRGEDWTLRPFSGFVVSRRAGSHRGVASYNPNAAPDPWQTTPLLTAAEYGKWKTLKLLLDHNAEVDAKDAEGYTALLYAAQPYEGDKDGIIGLLRHHANPNIADSSGDTPLTLVRGRPDLVALLKQYGAKE